MVDGLLGQRLGTLHIAGFLELAAPKKQVFLEPIAQPFPSRRSGYPTPVDDSFEGVSEMVFGETNQEFSAAE